MATLGLPDSSAGKESACNARDPGSIPGSGRSPGEGIGYPTPVFLGPPCGSAGKGSACNAGELGSIPGLGKSPGEGNGYPLQYSGLENSMDCMVHGVAKSRTWLSNLHFPSLHGCTGLHCCPWPFSSFAELCRVVPRGLLISVASLGAEHGLKGVYTSAVASHELSSCSSWAVDHRLGRCGTQA